MVFHTNYPYFLSSKNLLFYSKSSSFFSLLNHQATAMASGSSGRGNLASKGFYLASDDILCSYEDYGNHNDPGINTNSTKTNFHKTRMARTSMFPANAYSPPEDCLSQDMIATVEKSKKKYADNLMRFLEGIS